MVKLSRVTHFLLTNRTGLRWNLARAGRLEWTTKPMSWQEAHAPARLLERGGVASGRSSHSEFDRFDFGDKPSGIVTQERGDHVEHSVTKAADVQDIGTLGCLCRSVWLDVDADQLRRVDAQSPLYSMPNEGLPRGAFATAVRIGEVSRRLLTGPFISERLQRHSLAGRPASLP